MSASTAVGGAQAAESGSEAESLRASAWVLGGRLDVAALPLEKLVAQGPNVYALGPDCHLAAFRYGAIVFFGASELQQVEWTQRLAPFVEASFLKAERDELAIRIDPGAKEGPDAKGDLVLNAPSVERFQVVAHALAKSTVLAHYEQRVAEAFSRVEARARRLSPGLGRRESQEALGEIRDALAIRVQTVGRIEPTEKPEILWDSPDLDRLYDQLSLELELRERDAALSRKLALISDTATTSLELIHTRRALRVEWYIVILIVVEIVLFIYEIARR